jgi:hypothetical protein
VIRLLRNPERKSKIFERMVSAIERAGDYINKKRYYTADIELARYFAYSRILTSKELVEFAEKYPKIIKKVSSIVETIDRFSAWFEGKIDQTKFLKKNPKKVKLKNPKKPTLEFWNKVFPHVYKYYKKKGLAFAKKRGYKSVKEIASATTASIWYEKISPTRKAVYERLRRKREGKVKSNPLVEYYKIKNPIQKFPKKHSKHFKKKTELEFLEIKPLKSKYKALMAKYRKLGWSMVAISDYGKGRVKALLVRGR